MSTNALFTYGTLMVPEIWRAVTLLSDATPPRPGKLRGYRRRRVNGADFPGIFVSVDPSDTVAGCIYENVCNEVLARLDRYEDDFYQRIKVDVETATEDSTPTLVPCQTYIVPKTASHVLSDEPWNLDWFKEHAVERYLKALENKSRSTLS